MKRLEFECKLLSDVVIKSTPATEGFDKNLDYIPGSKFLGIVAKKMYSIDNTEKTLDLFHNGNVCFSDAHVKIENKRSLKIPFSYFYIKGNDLSKEIFLHHKLTAEQKIEFSRNGIQLKQARTGYFADDKFINLENNFAIKSAYSSENRKAKDAQMYGYFSLLKGSVWSFYVDTKEEYIDEIKKELTNGKKRIGRSRSAEYGLVHINFVSEINKPATKTINSKELLIYAESNLCFYDEYGQNTLQPTIEQLKLTAKSSINWGKSQIRTRKYQTWNNKRYNRDADRMIIEKGSVFFVELASEINTSIFINGIGSHKNEGFGQVLINPDFLISDNVKLEEFKISLEKTKYIVEKGKKDDLLKIYLSKQKNAREKELNIDKLVNDFKQQFQNIYTGITASQWGQVRNYAKHAANEKVLEDLLFKEEFGYFMHGQSENKWRSKNRRNILRKVVFSDNATVSTGSKIEFIQKLAAEMGKNVKTKA